MVEIDFFDYSIFAILILLGVSFLAGFIDSIAGGGGLLIVPTLMLFGLPAQSTLGTSKFISTLGTAIAAFNFIRAKTIVWKLIVCGIWFTLAGSYIGAKSVLLIAEETVAVIIVVLIPVVVLIVLIPKPRKPNIQQEWSKLRLCFYIPVVCFMTGFYDGFFGPGIGIILILAFHILFDMSLTLASGTAKVFNLASNVGAVMTFLFASKCIMAIALPMAASNMIGNYVGSKLAIKKGDILVRYMLIISALFLVATLVYKFLIN